MPPNDPATSLSAPAVFGVSIIDRSHTDLAPILDNLQALKHNQSHTLIWMLIGPRGSGRKQALQQIEIQARDLLDGEGAVVELNLEMILKHSSLQAQLQSALRTLATAVKVEPETRRDQEAT